MRIPSAISTKKVNEAVCVDLISMRVIHLETAAQVSRLQICLFSAQILFDQQKKYFG